MPANNRVPFDIKGQKNKQNKNKVCTSQRKTYRFQLHVSDFESFSLTRDNGKKRFHISCQTTCTYRKGKKSTFTIDDERSHKQRIKGTMTTGALWSCKQNRLESWKTSYYQFPMQLLVGQRWRQVLSRLGDQPHPAVIIKAPIIDSRLESIAGIFDFDKDRKNFNALATEYFFKQHSS